MAGIAGINKPDQNKLIDKMLDKISYRGNTKKIIFSTKYSSMGIITNNIQSKDVDSFSKENCVKDYFGEEHLAEAKEIDGILQLKRDVLGAAPLYYGYNVEGALCFASEIKAMLEVTKDIKEVLPGNILIDNKPVQYFKVNANESLNYEQDVIAQQLYKLLDNKIEKSVFDNNAGCWLSGGLDSSIIASLLSQYVNKLHTFSVGIKGAQDLEYSKIMSDYLKSIHHEIIVTPEEMIKILPDVIYHLETFDALLIRSSITNFIASKEASNYVEHVFSGEGGDELFGGYDYLKKIPLEKLNDELIDITYRLHNTALQRVDRNAAAFGTIASVIFANPDVVEFAFKISPQLKIMNGKGKWILRLSMKDKLPKEIFNRAKAKFWEGAGVGEILAEYANKKVSDTDFQKERKLKNGWELNSKEELLYYRIFKEHFGDLDNLDWMGRTKIV